MVVNCTRFFLGTQAFFILPRIVQLQALLLAVAVNVRNKVTTVVPLDGIFSGQFQEEVIVCQHHILKGYGGIRVVIFEDQFQYGDRYHVLVSPYLVIALPKG